MACASGPAPHFSQRQLSEHPSYPQLGQSARSSSSALVSGSVAQSRAALVMWNDNLSERHDQRGRADGMKLLGRPAAPFDGEQQARTASRAKVALTWDRHVV